MSGTQFPANPSDGQLFTTAGATWRYNAATQTWVNANTGGSFVATDNGVANQPTLNQPVVMGVTDGSNAGPGEVGETLYAATAGTTESSLGTITVSNATTTVIVSISLPPGDWQLSGIARVDSSGYTFNYNFLFAVNNNQISQSVGGSGNGSVQAAVASLPISVATTTSVSLMTLGSTTWAGGYFNSGGEIRARRVR